MTEEHINAAKRYLWYSLLGHSVWEVVQLPLYTIFWTAPAGTTAFAIVHCTAGDMLIAAATLGIAYLLAGNASGPWTRPVYVRVAGTTVVLGVLYTAFSEWLNTAVRHTWAYTSAMPLIPVLNVGAAPLLQWIVVPVAAFVLTARHMRSRASMLR